MKITVVDRFWVVTNPTQESEIADIMFLCDLEGLENQIIGAERGGYRFSTLDPAIYSDYAEAHMDATARLAA